MDRKTENLVRNKSLEILFNKYKADNEKLKAENERLRKYEKKIIGYLIILLSTVIFSILIITTNIQFVIMGFFTFALICVGIFLIFIYSPETYYLDISNSTLETTIKNLIMALSTFSLENYSVFLPVGEEVYQFVPFLSHSTPKKYPSPNELTENIFKISEKGVILESSGKGLLGFVKNEFPLDQLKKDLGRIEIYLRELLIDKMNLVKSLSFTRLEKGQYELVLTDNIFANIYQLEQLDIKIVTQIGGPICNFIANILAQMTNHVVLLKSHKFNKGENISTFIYELGELYP